MPRGAGKRRSPTPRRPAGPTAPRERARWSLGPAEGTVQARLGAWAESDAVGRIWAKDPTFWPRAPASDVADRLGWLHAPEESAGRTSELRAFAGEVAGLGFQHVVLFGMGGSSLAAEVIARALPGASDRPTLSVLDSTHPNAVRAALDRGTLDRTLFVVSSKSGTTLEPNAFFRTAWARVGRSAGPPGRQFVAITDPGTPLERLARERKFRHCFSAPPDVGGRYSALTVFGLVPGALAGVDLDGLLGRARAMATTCAEPSRARENPGLRLGAALGELARGGRDKVVLFAPGSLRSFPAWVEQLLAESLGKDGRGIVPVANPPPPGELPRGPDAVYVRVSLRGEHDDELEAALEAREADGAPVLRFELASPLDLGGEFFRWEFATAACGAVLEVDPFDQPDVEHAKELARRAMERPRGAAAPAEPYGVRADDRLAAALERWAGSARPGDYVAVQAFLAPGPETDASLDRLASALRRSLGVVVTIGYGPRFLHSTGQLHKGGPASGLFLQLVDEPSPDLDVPELGLTFGQIVRAQASGDRGALEEKRRRVLVVNLGTSVAAGLDVLAREAGPA